MTELGITLMKSGKMAEALEKFYAAKAFYEKQNHVNDIAQCYLLLGKVESAMGLFRNGYELTTETGDKSQSTVLLTGIASEKLKSGDSQEAIHLLQAAKEIALRTQEKPLLTNWPGQITNDKVAKYPGICFFICFVSNQVFP